MMSTELEKPLKYFENEKFFIVEFPYADSNFSAFFIVPKEEIKTLFPLKYS